MLPLSAIQLKITTSELPTALPNLFSYTLENTPFYITPVMSTDTRAQLIDNMTYWDFGDGTFKIGLTASHFYKTPGSYNIKATFYDLDGEPNTVSTATTPTTATTPATVTVINALPDKIVFEPFIPAGSLGIYTLPAGKCTEPLKIYRYNSWQNDPYLLKNNYSIMLYASGSRSSFMSLSSYYTSKWSHLKSYFGFLQKYTTPDKVETFKIIDSTATTSVSVYAERAPAGDKLLFYNFPKTGTAFAGTTGSTEGLNVVFTDQKFNTGSDKLVFLYANFDTRGFLELDKQNIERNFDIEKIPYGYINFPTQASYLKTVFNPAETLAITSNGITVEGRPQTVGPVSGELLHSFSIYPVKWCNTQIPFVVTFKDKDNFTTKCYPPITAVKFDGSDPTEINTMSIGLFKYAGQDPVSVFTETSTFRVTSVQFTINNKVPSFENSGSYYSGILKHESETTTVVLCASVLIKDNPLISQGTPYGFAGQRGFKKVRRFQKEPIYNNCSGITDFSLTGNYETYSTPTSSTIAISIAPLKTYSMGEIDRVWVADADEDRVFVYTLSGTLMTTIKLSAVPTYTGEFTAPTVADYLGELDSASPSNIAIDRQGNAWISLYDAVSVIRYNPRLNLVDRVAAPKFRDLNVAFTDPAQYISNKDFLSGYMGESLLLPSCIDTDLDSKIVVGYSHPVSGFIARYNDLGAIDLFIEIPQLYSLQELFVDRNNNIIAFAKNLTENYSDPFRINDVLYKWNSSGELLSGYPRYFNFLGNISIDLEQNLWAHHDFCKVSKITPQGIVSELFVGNSNYDSRYYQGIDGIGLDTEGYMWVLHNFDGRIYFYPTTNTAQIPLSSLFYTSLPDIQLSAPDGQQAFYSVFGDWTGIRWLNKYATTINPLPRIIRGKSNLFDIYNLTPIINKQNENFDLKSTLKSYVLQESLFDKSLLWDDFVGQIVGGIDSPPESLGKTIYEKIANFSSNVSDPDTCNIPSLKSLTVSKGLPFYDFTTGYPSKLMRAVDILSINHSKLYGTRAHKQETFVLSACDFSTDTNLGSNIDISTGSFIVGEPIIAYDIFNNSFRVIENTVVPTTDNIVPKFGSPYPLSGVNYNWGWNLVTGNIAESGIDIKPYYAFYSFIPNKKVEMVDGIIDFNNPQTTIAPKVSSYNEWTKFGGIMERVISRSLYEGLDLIK